MTIFDRIKKLAEKRGRSLQEIALELGLSENIFYTWKKSSPKVEVLKKVAEYFGVPIDYLAGGRYSLSELKHFEELAQYDIPDDPNPERSSPEEDFADIEVEGSLDLNSTDLTSEEVKKENRTIFSSNLKKLRKKNFETITELSRTIGVSQSTLSSWESGKSMPKLESIKKIASHYGVETEDLLSTPSKKSINKKKIMEEVAVRFRTDNNDLSQEEYDEIMEKLSTYFDFLIHESEKKNDD